MKKKLLAFLLCAAMLATTLTLPVSALAEGTHFLLTLVGETALRDGTWESEPVVAEFRAVQHDETVGILKADGETRLACEGGTLILYPVAETLPEGWHFEAGYAVNLTDNALNKATIRVQAEAGFFKAAAEPGAVFVLTPAEETEDERFPMELTADDEGVVCPERAVPAGDYLLQDAAGSYEPLPLSVRMYTGLEEDIAAVDATAEVLVPMPVTVTFVRADGLEQTAAVSLLREERRIDLFLSGGETAEQPLTPGEWTLVITAPEGTVGILNDMVFSGENRQALDLTENSELVFELAPAPTPTPVPTPTSTPDP